MLNLVICVRSREKFRPSLITWHSAAMCIYFKIISYTLWKRSLNLHLLRYWFCCLESISQRQSIRSHLLVQHQWSCLLLEGGVLESHFKIFAREPNTEVTLSLGYRLRVQFWLKRLPVWNVESRLLFQNYFDWNPNWYVNSNKTWFYIRKPWLNRDLLINFSSCSGCCDVVKCLL